MANVQTPNRPYAEGQHRTSGTGVGDTLRQAASSVEDAASDVAHRVEDAWDSTTQGVREGAEFVANKASNFWSDCTEMIRRHPVTSVMIAFGLGCLTASLFSLPMPGFTDDMARRMSRASE
jgi:ElaB/YqjD/DUF883 family membrane-anchored ribosome-binding protein